MKYVSHFISSYTSFIKGQANVKLDKAHTYICLWEKSNTFSCWKITKTYLHDCNKVATSRSNMEVLTGLLTVLFSIFTDFDVFFYPCVVILSSLPVYCIVVTTSLGACALSYLYFRGSQWSPVALNSLFSIWVSYLILGRPYI